MYLGRIADPVEILSILPGDRSQWLAVCSCMALVIIAGCAGDDPPTGPNLIDHVLQVRWELVPGTEQCPVMGSPSNECLVPLQLVFTWQGGFVDHKGMSCCLDCERYAPACQLGLHVVEFATGNLPLSPRVRIPGHKPRPGMVIWIGPGGIPGDVTRDWCGPFLSSDLESSSLQSLKDFLDQLTMRYSEGYDLDPHSDNPRDVCLYVSNADPPTRTDSTGATGYVGGEISCAAGTAAIARNCRYQITLYRQAFYGQCARKPYNTVAHEFKHILQSIDLGLPTATCDQAGSTGDYEQEAKDWANSIVEDCTGCP